MIRYVKVSFGFNKRSITVSLSYEDVRHLADNSYDPEKGFDCLALMAFHQLADQVRGRSDSTLWDLAFDVAGVLQTVVTLSYGRFECAPSDQLEAYLRDATNILNGARTGRLFRVYARVYKDMLE